MKGGWISALSRCNWAIVHWQRPNGIWPSEISNWPKPQPCSKTPSPKTMPPRLGESTASRGRGRSAAPTRPGKRIRQGRRCWLRCIRTCLWTRLLESLTHLVLAYSTFWGHLYQPGVPLTSAKGLCLPRDDEAAVGCLLNGVAVFNTASSECATPEAVRLSECSSRHNKSQSA